MLISDLDNTLYNFVDYFAPCFRGMVRALSAKLRISEVYLISQFKDVFGKHNSIEYAFAVQELECVMGRDKEEIQEIIKIAKGAFSKVRNKHLTTYPNVKETLKWLREQDTIIVGVSNAPKFHALRRLRQLRIEQFFDALVCWEGVDLPYDIYSKEIIDKEQNGGYKSKIKAENILKLPKHQLKPNVDGYKIMLEKFNVQPQDCYIVGDSISKDVHPAFKLGANGIWAKYGEIIERKNLSTVLSISNWDKKKVSTIYFESFEEPQLIIEDFSDLRHILKSRQLKFDF